MILRERIQWLNEGFRRLKELLPGDFQRGKKSMTKVAVRGGGGGGDLFLIFLT